MLCCSQNKTWYVIALFLRYKLAQKRSSCDLFKKRTERAFSVCKNMTNPLTLRFFRAKPLDSIEHLCYTDKVKLVCNAPFKIQCEHITKSMSSPAARRRFFSYNQPHIFHTLTVFRSGADNIDPSSVDTAVTENVCKLGDVLLDTVVNGGAK